MRVTIAAHDKQREFLLSTAPNVVFQGGAGSGKTWTGVLKALLLALTHAGSRGMLIAPSHPQMDQAMTPHLLNLSDALGQLNTWHWNKAKNIITLKNGSVIFLRTATDPGSLLGADLAWCVGDEVALWKREAYQYLMGRLRQPEFPHQAAFTFTPKGRNWAWEVLGQPRDGLHIVKVTTHDNPYLTEDFRERLRREYGEGTQFWQQEVLGEYVAWEGLIYGDFSVETHVLPAPPRHEIVRIVVGVDWGWTNPGVMLVLGLDRNGSAWVLDEVYETQRDINWWANAAKELRDRWGHIECYCDPSEPGNIAALQAAGITAREANNAVIPGITEVASRLRSRRLMLTPDCLHTREEMGLYCWRRRPDGSMRADEPDKVHDHAMDALRYAVMGLVHVPSGAAVQFSTRRQGIA